MSARGQVADLGGGWEGEAGFHHVGRERSELEEVNGHFADIILERYNRIGEAAVLTCPYKPSKIERPLTDFEVFLERKGTLPNCEACGAAVDVTHDAEGEVAVKVVPNLRGADHAPADPTSIPVVGGDVLHMDEGSGVVWSSGSIAENHGSGWVLWIHAHQR